MMIKIVFCKLNQVSAPQAACKWTPDSARDSASDHKRSSSFEQQKQEFSHHEETFQQQQQVLQQQFYQHEQSHQEQHNQYEQKVEIEPTGTKQGLHSNSVR